MIPSVAAGNCRAGMSSRRGIMSDWGEGGLVAEAQRMKMKMRSRSKKAPRRRSLAHFHPPTPHLHLHPLHSHASALRCTEFLVARIEPRLARELLPQFTLRIRDPV